MFVAANLERGHKPPNMARLAPEGWAFSRSCKWARSTET